MEIHTYQGMNSLIMNYMPNSKYKDSCKKLDTLYREVLDIAASPPFFMEKNRV